MRTRLFLLSVIFISPVLCLLYGQETEYKLQLMKVGIAGDQFQSIESDTLRYSFYNDPNDLYSSYNSKSFYTNNFYLDGSEYLLIKDEKKLINVLGGDYKIAIKNLASGIVYTQNPIYSFSKAKYVMPEPYAMENPRLIKIDNGIWILGGYLGNAFFSNSKVISNFRPILTSIPARSDSTLGLILQDIIGKVGNRYIGVFTDNFPYIWEFQYYIIDLNQSPFINPITARRVYFPNEYNPKTVIHLRDNIYLERNASYMNILQLNDSTFTILKEIPFYSGWLHRNINYRRNNIYIECESDLKKMGYDSTTNDIKNSEVLINTDAYSAVAYDQDLRYGLFIKNDSAYIYDIDKEAIVNRIYTPGELSAIHPFIDTNSAYIHAILESNIGINEIDGSIEPLTYKLSAYPNPFNPQTTIAFTIPNAGKVELAVYDLLGRKVTELLNEYRDKGSYEVKFNGANLASGIYFYTIKTGNFVKTEKLMLLK